MVPEHLSVRKDNNYALTGWHKILNLKGAAVGSFSENKL